MLARPLLSHILGDDALTRGLADPEARILVEWLVDQAEHSAYDEPPESVLREAIRKLCRRGRAISRFVMLWCHEQRRGAACQLAAVERFAWPLPTCAVDPYELMESILEHEAAQNNA